MDRVMRLVSKNAVVIFSMSSCCMCHSIKQLFRGLGVNVVVYELDEDTRGREMENVLVRLLGRNPPVPAVFIGGELVGPTDSVMSLHLNGSLVPMLKAAGALWL
ncbi:putative glutaredoxin-C14 [Magnolia sinica]|uniref:putative glutaredoxin-C14 n=1 Tax=Magnolia sinica TaxID=86752 RepID=UPI002657FD5C|nr:putative glutaredoxin-C14 [Magnolia sinica]